ncbi:hypothetical protein GCM10008956_15400 [Deinococcus arenae]|uniref:Uncharacterized protein n=1 Tax=Deinococcus arenae TaxID=1452751 RepID=A0A8H9GNS9_9DEIO|nr:hypothetical protein [Deinococcus arenae]GGM39892.1 hypothetical protein GCM10008956_15400 [Deinococcus arenae]
MQTEPLIVLGERGRLPQLALLGCTIFEDRIEAKGFILYAPLKRGRTLARMQKAAHGWTVPRGALLARAPRLPHPQVSLHAGLTLPLARRGR